MPRRRVLVRWYQSAANEEGGGEGGVRRPQGLCLRQSHLCSREGGEPYVKTQSVSHAVLEVRWLEGRLARLRHAQSSGLMYQRTQRYQVQNGCGEQTRVTQMQNWGLVGRFRQGGKRVVLRQKHSQCTREGLPQVGLQLLGNGCRRCRTREAFRQMDAPA